MASPSSSAPQLVVICEMDTSTPPLTALSVLDRANAFREKLKAARAAAPDVRWYPYDSMTNIEGMKRAIGGHDFPIERVVDIGPADGDIAFMFADAGAQVHAIEHPDTNYNNGAAIRALNARFGNRVSLEFTDIDFGFRLDGQFDLCVMTGVAYHLRNPLLAYITIAQHCRYLITNTKVADEFKGLDVGETPCAYLLAAREANNDPTNWWIFSPAGYERLLNRTGWIVRNSFCVGAERGSVDQTANKRMWAFCERTPNYARLTRHHDY